MPLAEILVLWRPPYDLRLFTGTCLSSTFSNIHVWILHTGPLKINPISDSKRRSALPACLRTVVHSPSPAGEPGLCRSQHVGVQHRHQLCLRHSQRVVLWIGLLPIPQLLPHCSHICQHLLHGGHRSRQVGVFSDSTVSYATLYLSVNVCTMFFKEYLIPKSQ